MSTKKSAGKKLPAINLRASMAVSPPSSSPTGDAAQESFLRGDKVQLLSVATIKRNKEAQPRLRLDSATVEAYRDVMSGLETGPGWGPFPPVVVFGKGEHFYLADGFHRIAAAEAAGLTTVRAEVNLGGLREAILYSVRANAAHGLRRTNEDKRRAVETLLRDKEWSQKSDRWIADHAAVSPDTVGRLRRELTSSLSGSDSEVPQVRVGKDGRVQNTTQIGRTQSGRVKKDYEALSESDSAATATPARSGRRSSQSPSVFDAVVKALKAAAPRDEPLPVRDICTGLIAFAQWGAGGDGKKARMFLRKLGARVPREMTSETSEPARSGVRQAR